MIHFLVVFALLLPLIHLLNFVAPFAEQSQTKCLWLIKSDIQNQALHRAFFCGQPLREGPLKTLWVSSGLYHLLVVSGSHLVFLTTLLGLFRKSKIVKLITGPVLGIFTLATGFQPPLVRALFAMALHRLSKSQKLFWPRDVVVSLSGLTCLLCFPEWMRSQSLLLSWLASLALTQGRTVLQKSILIFLVMLPCIWGWGQINPFTILTNVFLGPLMSALIVASGMALLLSTQLSEQILNFSISVLTTTNEVMPPSATTEPLPRVFLWGYLCATIICIHSLRIQRRQQQCKN